MKVKLLIVRFSSFGDILQCADVPSQFKTYFPLSSVHWAVRADFANILENNPQIDELLIIQRNSGLRGLLNLYFKILKGNYTHYYDAHNNLRSNILNILLLPQILFSFSFIQRPKNRIARYLSLRWKWKIFAPERQGRLTYLNPLKKWIIDLTFKPTCGLFFSIETTQKTKQWIPYHHFIALAPSAAWDLKRWPKEYFKELIELNPNLNFVILGGPEDTFCQELTQNLSKRVGEVLNLCGKLSLIESCAAISLAQALVSADTGLMHAADALGTSTLSLIGPTAFGYPTHPKTLILETELNCKPCSKDGRGRCSNSVYKKCMFDLTPHLVSQKLKEIL